MESSQRLHLAAATVFFATLLFAAWSCVGAEIGAAERLGDGMLPAQASGETTPKSTASTGIPAIATMRARREAVLKKTDQLYDEARAAYSLGEYKYATRLCDQILRLQPNHDKARKLRYNSNLKIFYREASARDQDYLLEAESDAVPPKKLIPIRRKPDMRSEALKRYDTEAMRAMQAALDEKVTLSFSEADLEYVLNVLFKLNNVNIIVDNKVVEGETITLLVKDMPLRDVLKFIARNKPKLDYTITENAIWFHSPQSPVMEPRVYPLHSGLMTPGGNSVMGGSSAGGRTGSTSGSTRSSSSSSRYPTSSNSTPYGFPTNYPSGYNGGIRQSELNSPARNLYADGNGTGGALPAGIQLPPEMQKEILDRITQAAGAGSAKPPAGGAGGRAGAAGGQGKAGGSAGAAAGGGHSVGDSYIERVLTFMQSWKDDWPQGTQWMIDRKSNQLLVYTTPEFHKEIEKILDVIDKPAPQVLIKARFIEIKLTDSLAIGFNDLMAHDVDAGDIIFGDVNENQTQTGTDTDGNPIYQTTQEIVPGVKFSNAISQIAGMATGGMTFAVTGRRTDPVFKLQLQLIAGDSRSRILSAPQIIAVNNQSADIFIGDKVQYVSSYREVQTTTTTSGTQTNQVSALVPDQFEDLDLGFSLMVTPSIGRDYKTIVLDIQPLITELAAGQTLADFGNATIILGQGQGTGNMNVKRPTTNERRLHTKVTIQDNGYVVIGGLIRNRQQEIENRVPYLSRIPFLGWLFKSRSTVDERSNLVIIVEAKIIDPSGRGYSDRVGTPETDEAARRLEEELMMKLDVFGEVNDLGAELPASLE